MRTRIIVLALGTFWHHRARPVQLGGVNSGRLQREHVDRGELPHGGHSDQAPFSGGSSSCF